MTTHSFTDNKGLLWMACCECDRGGNGNAEHKCSFGWRCTEWNKMGCYLGTAIVGQRRKPLSRPLSRSARRAKARYGRWLEFGDSFDNFRDFLSWDSDPERSWNVRK